MEDDDDQDEQFGMIPNIILRPKNVHTASVVFLHGLGDTGYGWDSAMQVVQSHIPYVKFILPTAPVRPITLNGGMRMNGWYDIRGLAANAIEDDVGIRESASFVHKTVREEIASGIPSERIVVGGFSQGGAISLFSGLTCPDRIGGILALSSYLPLRKAVPHSMTRENLNTPILMCHGTADMVVNFTWGKLSFEFLTQLRNSQQPHLQQPSQSQIVPPVDVATARDFSRMSTKELKELLSKHNIDTSSCIEKSDLLEKAQSHLPQILAGVGTSSGDHPQPSNANIEFKTYEDMGHSACDEEINDIISWIKRVLPPK